MTAPHRAQDPIAARLHGQMNPLAEVFVFIDRGHDVRMKITWERSRKLDALNSGRRRRSQQSTERGSAFESFQPCLSPRPVTVYVLSNQMNFAIAVVTQLLYFSYDLNRGATLFSSARIRNNAIRAELVAAFDDGNKGNVL